MRVMYTCLQVSNPKRYCLPERLSHTLFGHILVSSVRSRKEALTLNGVIQVFERYHPLYDMFSLKISSELIQIGFTSSRCCSGSAFSSPNFTLTVTKLKFAPVMLQISTDDLLQTALEGTYPGSLTITLDTSSTVTPSPPLPSPYPVSSCSSLRAVVLLISHIPTSV